MNQFIREPECRRITGLSRPTRWRLEREGRFPKRIHITQNTIGWLADDIDQWMQSRIDASSTVSKFNKKHLNGENNEAKS